jgi:tetraacyldisaccharide 4'-kinase
LDVVLISAANPFGFGHALPRGLLREPVSGLGRADAVIVTHADQASSEELRIIEQTVRRYNTNCAVLRAVHSQTGLKDDSGVGSAMEQLSGKRFFVFAGIANPTLFGRQLQKFGTPVGSRWFGDHHNYSSDDIRRLREEATAKGAELLVTTEKDWVKFERLSGSKDGIPIWRVEMRLEFLGNDGERFAGLLDAVTG